MMSQLQEKNTDYYHIYEMRMQNQRTALKNNLISYDIPNELSNKYNEHKLD